MGNNEEEEFLNRFDEIQKYSCLFIGAAILSALIMISAIIFS